MTKPLRLFFIRHGQTETSGGLPPFNGWRDAPLTELGQRQLDQAAGALAHIPFDAVYSSDLSRAVYGGRCLAEKAGRELRTDPKWREISFGRWEGMTYKEIYAESPELITEIFSPEGFDTPFPGGESLAAFFARISQAMDDLLALHPDGGRIALVAHGGVCKALWGRFLQAPLSTAWAVWQDFAAINVADIYPDGRAITRLVNGCAGNEGFERLLGADIFK
jgi:broad specificity phosphatase PhoE